MKLAGAYSPVSPLQIKSKYWQMKTKPFRKKSSNYIFPSFEELRA